MAEDAVELIRLRNNFYRDNYRRLVGILLIAIIIILILIGALTYIVTHPPIPRYFATDVSGRIIPLVPLNQPNLSKPALQQWANIAAVAAFTYDFVNYRQELQAASEFFTPTGWEAFLRTLESTGNMKAVIAQKLVVTAVATGAPVIIQQGIVDGRYSWRVNMPILVTYESANRVVQQSLIVNMLITRVSTLDSPRGIGIAQFIATSSGTVGQINP